MVFCFWDSRLLYLLIDIAAKFNILFFFFAAFERTSNEEGCEGNPRNRFVCMMYPYGHACAIKLSVSLALNDDLFLFFKCLYFLPYNFKF